MLRFRILQLCGRGTWRTKMSRVRFHGMDAVGKIHEVRRSGPGWPDWDCAASVASNMRTLYGEHLPDFIEAYKPLGDRLACDHILRDIAESPVPVILRYNEMFDVDEARWEIAACGARLVICHHANEMELYTGNRTGGSVRFSHGPVYFRHIPHSAEASIFKPYGRAKRIDVMLVGHRGRRYPLRNRMAKLLPQLPVKYHWREYRHPGYVRADAWTNRYAREFAQAISDTRICVTCSGRPRTRYGKYVEIPMCGAALAADMPDEEQDAFGEFLIELDMGMTDSALLEQLVLHLERPDLLTAKTAAGQRWATNYTQEKYAERFTRVLQDFLQERANGGRR